MKDKIALIGLGNILLRDEGIGVHLVEALRQRFHLPDGLLLVDGGTLGLDLLPLVEGAEKVLFIDALDLRKEPGTLAILEEEEIPSFLKPKFSFHQVGLPDLLFAARFMGIRPSKIALIGIQPEKIEAGLTLSGALNRKFEILLQSVLGRLREWGVELKEKIQKEAANVPGCSL